MVRSICSRGLKPQLFQRAAPHQPVVRIRILEHRVGDGGEVALGLLGGHAGETEDEQRGDGENGEEKERRLRHGWLVLHGGQLSRDAERIPMGRGCQEI